MTRLALIPAALALMTKARTARLASIPVAMFVVSLIGAGYGWIVGDLFGAMVGNYGGAALGAWLAGRR